MTPALPQELVDCIIDELGSHKGVSDPECRRALMACSLASSSFLTPSRKHLFAKVQLKESHNEKDERLLALARILDARVEDNKINFMGRHIPPLASHIRTLSIILSPTPANRNLMHGKKTLRRKPPPDIPAILEYLIARSPIASFSLEVPNTSNLRGWKFVDKLLKAGIESLCKLPSITALQFQRIQGLPTTLITGCPNLKALSFRSIYPDIRTAGSFPHLESLAVGNSEDFLQSSFFSDPSSFAKLRHIEFSVDAFRGPLNLGVLKMGPSLQSIRFKVHCYWPECEHIMIITMFPSMVIE